MKMKEIGLHANYATKKLKSYEPGFNALILYKPQVGNALFSL